jgi:F-type H+-transporting ATPase subunit a
MAWLVMIVLVWLAVKIRKNIASSPNKIQNSAELVIEALYDLVKQVAGDRAKTFFPIITTIFFFILASNWIGLLPGVSSIGFYEHLHGKIVFVPFLRSSAADLNITLGLGIITVVLTQYFGIRFKGIYGYIRHYFHNPLKGGIALILLGVLLGAFVGALEVVSEFVKIISLSLRLFGNVYAGEVVIGTISGIMGYIAPVPFLLLETIVGLVQAAVFSLLTLVFFSIISQPIDHESH